MNKAPFDKSDSTYARELQAEYDDEVSPVPMMSTEAILSSNPPRRTFSAGALTHIPQQQQQQQQQQPKTLRVVDVDVFSSVAPTPIHYQSRKRGPSVSFAVGGLSLW
jgi:hypothetical protein